MASRLLGTALSVVAAGIVGTVANAVAAAAYLGLSRLDLALMPGRYGVAIACVATLPFIFLLTREPARTVLSLVALTALPSLIAKIILAADAPWTTVIVLNAVFAVFAFGTYWLLARRFR